MITKTIITLMIAGAVLTACSYSVDDLVENKELRRQILKECIEMGLVSKDEEKCQVAIKAEAEAAKRTVEGLLK